MEGQPNAFMEKFAKTAEAKIEVDKIRNTHNNAVDLFKNNVDFFGSGDEEKSSEIATRVLERFGRNYKNVSDIIAASRDPNRDNRRALSDLDSLTDSVFIAMNMSVLGNELVTDSMTAEQIDEVLPKQMEGIGEKIVEKKVSGEDKKNVIEINERIESSNLFTNQDNIVRGEAYKKWGEAVAAEPENSLVKQYVEVGRAALKDLGIEVKQEAGQRNGRKTYATYTPGAPDDDGNGGGGEYGFSYGPEKEDFVTMVMRSTKTEFRRNMPPRWFKEASSGEKYWYEMVDYVSECAGNKTALKDSIKGCEKLFLDDNTRTKLYEADFRVMYERKGFEQALEKIVDDLCELKADVPGGTEFLYLKEHRDDKGNWEIDKEVERRLEDLDTYKEEVAMYICKQKVYSEKGDCENLFKDEVGGIVTSRGLTEQQALEEWKKIHGFDDSQIEAGTAWNFLYICDFVDSADYRRYLKPIDPVKGDTINFFYHPDAKVSSKLRVEKEDKVGGKEEIKGGPLADWYTYQLQHDKNFKEEYRQGKNRLFPERLGVGFLDTYKVTTAEGETMSMSQALKKGQTIDCNKMPHGGASRWNIFQEWKDMHETSLNTFRYLSGEVPLDGKNTQQWAIGATNALALLRQQGVMPDGKVLPVIDDVRLYAAIIYASFGVNPSDKLLTVNSPFPDYKEALKQITMKGFIKSSKPELNKPLYKDGPSKFQKQVFDYVYKNAFKRGWNEVFG